MINKFLKQNIKDQKKVQSAYFVFTVVGTYLFWKICSFFLETYEPLWWIKFQDYLAYQLIKTAVLISGSVFSVPAPFYERNIFIPNSSVIYVANHCLGIPAMFVFTLIIIAFGGSIKNKLWYIPVGIVGILSINCMRIVGLVVLMKKSSPLFWELNHKYTMLLLTYGFIFWMIKVWMDKFAETN